MTRRIVAQLAPFLALVVWALPVAAQDVATAQSLFDEGRSLLQQRQYDRACAKFAESQRVGPAAGTLLNLGECYAKVGKTASAWAAFKEAIVVAQSAGQADRERFARERVAELEPTLAKLSIVVQAPNVPELVVRRDGIELGQAAWGTAVAVDPGRHVVEAAAPGKMPWQTTVEVSSARGEKVVVPMLEDEPSPPVATRPFLEHLTQRNVGIGIAALGVAAVAVGSVVGLNAISTNDDAKTHCRSGNLCDETGLELLDSARSQATTSTVFFVLGLAAMAGGGILFFTAPASTDSGARQKVTTRVRFAPALTPSAGAFAVTGTW